MSQAQAQLTGSVKWFDEKKGYGFIAVDGGNKDAFVHITAVKEAKLQTLIPGARVSFTLAVHAKTRKEAATDLRMI